MKKLKIIELCLYVFLFLFISIKYKNTKVEEEEEESISKFQTRIIYYCKIQTHNVNYYQRSKINNLIYCC